jgi:hypothetical protein
MSCGERPEIHGFLHEISETGAEEVTSDSGEHQGVKGKYLILLEIHLGFATMNPVRKNLIGIEPTYIYHS